MTFSESFRRWTLSLVFLFSPGGLLVAQPRITGFTPDQGPPGTQVRILGSGLRPSLAAPRVRFGNMNTDAALISASANQILAIAPERVPIGPITVITEAGTVTSQFFYYGTPFIDDFGTEIIGSVGDTLIFKKPVVGTPAATLTIVGGNFFVPGFPGLAVRIGSNAIPAQATAENQIQATIPPVLLTGYLSVQTTAGRTTNFSDYIYGSPRIEAFSGKGAAGDTIAVKGVNFLVKEPGQIQLRIGGALATQLEVLSNTNLTAVVPNTAITGALTLTAPGGSFITTSNFSVLPKVTAFAPNRGPAGTVVTLVGSGLTGTRSVLFGGVAASVITNLTSAQVSAVVPSGVVTGPITLATDVGTNVTENPFYGAPQITSFTPPSGPTGTAVTLNGINLLGATEVQLNDLSLPQFTVADNTRILLSIPANATSGRFQVITPGGTNQSSGNFTVMGNQPVVSSFGPKFGPAGTHVTLVGQNLGTVTRVTFNGVQAAFTVQSAVALEATVPSTATSGKIQVTNPEGSFITAEDFVVGSTADLRVTFGATPNPAVAFGPVTFNVLVVNDGPIPAVNTQVEVVIPAGMAFLSASSSFPFEVDGQRVIFNRGTVEPQGFFNGTVRANAGNTNESRIAIARAQSSTSDPNTGNNERQISVPVTSPKLDIELLSPTELLLSWPAAAEGVYSPKTAPTLSSPWVPAPGTPENDGARIQLNATVNANQQFFRLELN